VIASFARWTVEFMEKIPYWLVALIASVSIAGMFRIRVGQKVDGWNIFQVNESALLLFENEFRVRCSTPALAAHLAALAEHVFPVMLVLGLATRYAALALHHDGRDPAVRLPGRVAVSREPGYLFSDPDRARGGAVSAAHLNRAAIFLIRRSRAPRHSCLSPLGLT
jgi:hypothetical protein